MLTKRLQENKYGCEKMSYTRKERVAIDLIKKEDPNFFEGDCNVENIKKSLEPLLSGIYDLENDFGRCCGMLSEVYDGKYYDFDDFDEMKDELKKDRKQMKEYDLFEVDLRRKVLVDTTLIKILEIVVPYHKNEFLDGRMTESSYEDLMFRNCL